jgi:hypothetical protein
MTSEDAFSYLERYESHDNSCGKEYKCDNQPNNSPDLVTEISDSAMS